MNQIRRLKLLLLALVFVPSLLAALPNEVALAQNQNEDDTTNIGTSYNEDDCKAAPNNLDNDNCELINMIVIITNVLSGLAATVIVAMIVWGGIQYSMAGPDPSKVQAAKQKIINALIALLLLVFGYSIIQWLVPGGLL